MNRAGILDRAGRSLSAFWRGRDTRERTMLAAAVAALALGLYYALLIDPALSGRDRLNKDLPGLRQQAMQLKGLSKEAAALSGKSLSPAAAISEESIKTALARKGMRPQGVTLSGGLVKVTLASVSFAGILGWLDEMQKTARLSVVDANVVALAQPDMVNAVLTLRQPGNE